MAFPRTPEELQLLLRSRRGRGVNAVSARRGDERSGAGRGTAGAGHLPEGRADGIRPDGQTGLQVFAGESLARTAVFAKNHALTGLEFAHGIPGTLGGGVYMNAGAYGGEMKQVVTSVTVFRMDGTEQTLSAEASAFGYRTSVYQTLPCVIVRASLQLQPGDPDTIAQTMRALMEKRKASQPLELPVRRKHVQASGGVFCGPAHRAGWAQGAGDRRCGGVGKARRVRRQLRRRHHGRYPQNDGTRADARAGDLRRASSSPRSASGKGERYAVCYHFRHVRRRKEQGRVRP